MSNALDITDNSFEQEVVNTTGITLAGKIKVVKLNTDENLKSAKEYSVSGLPTLLVFKDGKPVERLVGLMPKTSILSNIEKHL